MKIPFLYDYACPWAYLASCRANAYFADLGVEIDFQPVRLADLAEKTAQKGVPPGERKGSWYVSDLRAWAEMVGAEFSPAAAGPMPDTRLLLQGALVARDHGAFDRYHHAAYRARWSEARPVEDPEVVHSLLQGAGLDADAALGEAQSDAVAQRLDADTRAAVERGAFGVPTLFVGDRMFFGNDRFELVRHFIAKAD